MAPIKFYVEALRNFGIFDGRSSRAEFWYFILGFWVLVLCQAAVQVVMKSGGDSIVGMILWWSVYVFHFIPVWAVAVRRLHDWGRSGFWSLIVGPPCILTLF